MKFRYKVLFINIILLSIGIGTVGFLMINKNFRLALDSQIKNAIEENNMIQSNVEYELLSILNSNVRDFTYRLADVGEKIASNMTANRSDIYILYNSAIIYSGGEGTPHYPEELWKNTAIGEKRYVLTEEDGKQYIYVSSCNTVQGRNLNIINKREATDAYLLMRQQEQYFTVLLLIVILFCSLFMFVISYLLTKPLEALNRVSASFGQGDYAARSDIKSKDEIGALAKTYNQMAQAVSEHVDELKDMVVRQEQFVADFTHEIKTPMTTIIGYADTLRSKDMSRENQIMAASYIFSEGKRLEAMSMKLFDLIYTKKADIPLQPIITDRLMQEAADSVLPAMRKKHITLRINFDNCSIYGEINLLKTAFINLLDNARKASAEHSEILFTGTVTEQGYVISVQDFGIGISEEHISHICDEFYMVDKSRSRQEGGTGLGLSLAALIFKHHNASFDITSKPGEGTTIYITFPDYKENKRDEIF